MAKQTINVGTTPNDRSGDSLRAAFQKINTNFTELYEAFGLSDTGQDTSLTFTGSTISTDDSSDITINQKTTITSQLHIGMEIFALNLRHVSSSVGLKQVYFDPGTGEFVILD